MTENKPEHIDLFYRQALLAGKRPPVIWGGDFDVLRNLHEYADADVGEVGYGWDYVFQTKSLEQARSLPYAIRYMKCPRNEPDLCKTDPPFCTYCWLNRADIPNPDSLFDQIKDKPSGQVRWHPGWRRHLLSSRVLAMRFLDAMIAAVNGWMDQVMVGCPLDQELWHVTDYYNNIRQKVKEMKEDQVLCYQIEGLPKRVCDIPLKVGRPFSVMSCPL